MGHLPNSAEARVQLADWYRTSSSGRALQALEAAYLRDTLRLCYGQNFLQIGVLGWEPAFWEPDCFRRAWIVAGQGGDAAFKDRRIIALADELPVASNSIDLLLMPHTLEFEQDNHQVLREVERVLRPEGQLHFLGFNPFSLFGVWRCLSLRQRRTAPGCGRFLSSWRMLDWLGLLKFEAAVTATFSLSRGGEQIMAPLSWFATGYAIRAIKRTYRLIPVDRLAPLRPHLAPQGLAGPTARDNLHE